MTERIYNNVLLAEDDEDDRIFFAEALNSILPATQLHLALDGESALDILQNNNLSPDIIFLDLNMPKYSGISVLQYIRNSEELKNMIVVVLTTCNTFAHINDCYKLGANFYIIKPLSFTQLSNFLKECFSRLDMAGNVQPLISEFVIKSASDSLS